MPVVTETKPAHFALDSASFPDDIEKTSSKVGLIWQRYSKKDKSPCWKENTATTQGTDENKYTWLLFLAQVSENRQDKKAVIVDKQSMFLQVNIAVISSVLLLSHCGIYIYMCKDNYIFLQISDLWANIPPNFKEHHTFKKKKIISKLNGRYV